MAVKIERKDRLRAKLLALPKEVRAEMKKALREGAEELVAMQKRLVQVDSGALRDSIGYTFGKYQAENSNVRGVSASAGLDDPDLSVTVHAGNAKAYYAAFVEFGTEPHSQPRNKRIGRFHPGSAARPFFFPSYRALKKRIRSRVTRATTKAAKTVAAQGK